MKKICLLLLVTVGLGTSLFSQRRAFEVSANPLVILVPEAGTFPISVEMILNDDWGVSLDGTIGSTAYAYLAGKHYFNPNKGADKFYLGAFAGTAYLFDETGYGLGFMTGYKWLSKSNISFDIAIGLGRDFTNNIYVLPYGKLHVGYRFGGKKGDE